MRSSEEIARSTRVWRRLKGSERGANAKCACSRVVECGGPKVKGCADARGGARKSAGNGQRQGPVTMQPPPMPRYKQGSRARTSRTIDKHLPDVPLPLPLFFVC